MESIKVIANRKKLQALYCPLRGIGLMIILCMASFTSKAQSFDEWFRQGKTLIKYMTQQIAALNACETSLKQGYAVAKNGLGSITNFSGAEMGLHQGYYNSLNTVNPLVKSDANINSIFQYQQAIISIWNDTGNLNGLSSDDKTYIQAVKSKVLDECSADLAELQTVLTFGKLQMTDDERISRINKLSASTKDKYVFSMTFYNQVKTLLIQRSQDQQAAQTIGRYYGIDN